MVGEHAWTCHLYTFPVHTHTRTTPCLDLTSNVKTQEEKHSRNMSGQNQLQPLRSVPIKTFWQLKMAGLLKNNVFPDTTQLLIYLTFSSIPQVFGHQFSPPRHRVLDWICFRFSRLNFGSGVVPFWSRFHGAVSLGLFGVLLVLGLNGFHLPELKKLKKLRTWSNFYAVNKWWS